jgi:threonylcarbamoyladenosine tRNA methylthiotransferase MtaB
MENQISENIKVKRAKILNELSETGRRRFYERFINRELDVVFEGKYRGMLKGTSSNFIPVYVNTNQPLRGRICKVQILEAADFGLIGVLSNLVCLRCQERNLRKHRYGYRPTERL